MSTPEPQTSPSLSSEALAFLSTLATALGMPNKKGLALQHVVQALAECPEAVAQLLEVLGKNINKPPEEIQAVMKPFTYTRVVSPVVAAPQTQTFQPAPRPERTVVRNRRSNPMLDLPPVEDMSSTSPRSIRWGSMTQPQAVRNWSDVYIAMGKMACLHGVHTEYSWFKNTDEGRRPVDLGNGVWLYNNINIFEHWQRARQLAARCNLVVTVKLQDGREVIL